MKKKLEQMQVELRETVVYQSPPELGALWTDVTAMMERINKEQSVFIQRNMRLEAAANRRRDAMMKRLKADAYIGGFFLFLLLFTGCMMAMISYDAERRHPEWKSKSSQATLYLIRQQELAKVLEEANTRADTRYKQLQDASTSNVKVDDGESD